MSRWDRPGPRRAHPQESANPVLTAFGVVAVTSMLLFYALESRSAWFVLAFAIACLASSAYGFLLGSWPFGLVELVWAGVAVARWRTRLREAAR